MISRQSGKSLELNTNVKGGSLSEIIDEIIQCTMKLIDIHLLQYNFSVLWFFLPDTVLPFTSSNVLSDSRVSMY
jgi:hypothetical protein